MKKVTALLLALAMALSLAACGSSSKSDDSSTSKSDAVSTDSVSTSALDGYPDHNVTCIVPVAAGSAVDLVSRVLCDQLDLGTNIVVENLGGASQTIGTAECLNRDHDGYTFSTVAMAGLLTQPLLTPSLGYTMDDFRILGEIGVSSNSTICVRPESDLKTAQDVIDLITSGESFTYGVANVGGISQLSSAEAIDLLGGSGGTEVIYNGTNELTAAMLSGEVAFTVQDDDVAFNYVQSGEWRILLTLTAEEDSAYFPGVPYIGQYVDGFVDMPGFKAAVIPADVPEEIGDYLEEKIAGVVNTDAYQDQMVAMGKARTTLRGADEFKAYLEEVNAAAEKIMIQIGLLAG